MALSQIVDYDSVRAVLGVSEDEIEDRDLDSLIFETRLTEDLREVSLTIYTDFLTAKVAATPPATTVRFVAVFQMYAAYFVANCLLNSLPMFAPKHITDGKATQDRVSDPNKALRENLPSDLSYVKSRLLDAYSDYSPSASVTAPVTRTLVVGVPLAVSPITG